MSAKNLPQDAKILLSEYEASGWQQKATSGPTGNPHTWQNIKGVATKALPDKGKVFDAQYSSSNGGRGVERFVRVGGNTYYTNNHYGENPWWSSPPYFSKITK